MSPARGTVERRAGAGVGEPDAARRERIKVRRRNVATAVHAEIPIAQIVGGDQEDVGRRDLRPGLQPLKRQDDGERSKEPQGCSHDSIQFDVWGTNTTVGPHLSYLVVIK